MKTFIEAIKNNKSFRRFLLSSFIIQLLIFFVAFTFIYGARPVDPDLYDKQTIIIEDIKYVSQVSKKILFA